MPYDENLAGRIRLLLADRPDVVEKKMFGGVAFMVRGTMACGVHHDRLMIRIGEEAASEAVKEPHVEPMNFTGRTMRSFAVVLPAGVRSDDRLRHWVLTSAEYAEASPTPNKLHSPLRSKRRRPAL